jgi:hypothetical protein
MYKRVHYNQVEEDEMGRACSTKWGRRGKRIGYWWECQRKEPARKTNSRWVDIGKVD